MRLHEPMLELIAEELPAHDGHRRWRLVSPSPGWFRPSVTESAWCAPRDRIGTLDVLARRYTLVVPAGLAGALRDHAAVDAASAASLVPHAVSYRDPIALVDAAPTATMAGSLAGVAAAAATAGIAAEAGRVFRAPTSGRFYGRPSPDKPPFAPEGSQLAQGATICLLEVMKTFHRVTYGGPDLPETARVIRVLVAEGADVNAGDPLLALE